MHELILLAATVSSVTVHSVRLHSIMHQPIGLTRYNGLSVTDYQTDYRANGLV